MYLRLNSIEVDVARNGGFFKFGKTQAWIETTKYTEWKPVVETKGGSWELWFLRFYVVLDRE